jgi:putative FmdB family regulatory protein
VPTYTYLCASCGEFEHDQSVRDDPLSTCPACHGEVRRVISPGTSFVIKGRGAAASNCGRPSPCCGRETRCDKPPCGK